MGYDSSIGEEHGFHNFCCTECTQQQTASLVTKSVNKGSFCIIAVTLEMLSFLNFCVTENFGNLKLKLDVQEIKIYRLLIC